MIKFCDIYISINTIAYIEMKPANHDCYGKPIRYDGIKIHFIDGNWIKITDEESLLCHGIKATEFVEKYIVGGDYGKSTGMRNRERL